MDQILFVFLTISVCSSMYFILWYKYAKLKKEYASFITTQILSNAITSQDEQEAHEESFIKFLSDSRNMAFEYIDAAQKQIKEFITIADQEFAFFDNYGDLTQQYPHYDAMKKISAEYKKLRSLLPEENNN